MPMMSRFFMKKGSEQFSCYKSRVSAAASVTEKLLLPLFLSSALLVDDLLRAAVAGADHLAVGLLVGLDDIERELVDAVLLDLGLDLALQLVAVFLLRPCRGGK